MPHTDPFRFYVGQRVRTSAEYLVETGNDAGTITAINAVMVHVRMADGKILYFNPDLLYAEG